MIFYIQIVGDILHICFLLLAVFMCFYHILHGNENTALLWFIASMCVSILDKVKG